MLVRDAMNTDIKVIRPDAMVIEAARQMRDGDFGVMPVCDGDRIMGMITDRDIAIRVVAEAKDPNACMVSDVMTGDVLFCSDNEDLEEVANRMADRQVRRLPVIDANKKLVGIVSVGDVAIMNQDQAAEALGGISEQRHDEPAATTMQH